MSLGKSRKPPRPPRKITSVVMKDRPIVHNLEEVADFLYEDRESHAGRRAGHHVTDLMAASDAIAEVGLRRYLQEGDTRDFTPFRGLAPLGRMIEGMLRPFISAQVEAEGYQFVPSGEMVVDGITGNLDWLLIGKEPSIVVEIKSKHSHPVQTVADQTRWMRQIKAYCHMAGATEVRLWTMYLGGRPPQAHLHEHRLTFTEREIQQHWGMLVKTKRYLESGDASSVPSP